MLKWRPPVVYKYLWKYVCLLAMVGLLAASLLRMIFKGPTYTAWNQSTVRYWTTAFCPTPEEFNLKISCYSLKYTVCDANTKIPLCRYLGMSTFNS